MRLFFSPKFSAHVPPPGHPERPERADVFAMIAGEFERNGGTVSAPRAASRQALGRVHDDPYLDLVATTAARSGVMLDEDTFTSPDSHDVALLAAGAAIDAAHHAWRTGEPALALVRPPGHHAERDRAMGFCLYNNIAIAAADLRAAGVARVAIVDIDVHHGNGTQHAFYRDPNVLFVSSHQFPYYPGTGAADETGAGDGLGFTLNLPLAAGEGDAEVHAAYDDRALPALERFAPDVILVSAGFDAHASDPLGGLRMTTEGYASLVAKLDAVAARICERRIAFVTEGGYHLEALGACLRAAIRVLN